MSRNVISFNVTIPSDEGFFGRSCSNPACGRYFKVHQESLAESMYCPYCAMHFSNDDLLTPQQVRYLQRCAEEKGREIVYQKADKMMAQLARQFSRSKYLKFTHKPSPYRPKPVMPRYRELKVDSELICPECSFRFQVYGIFGYCPGCRTENLLIYDANLAIIERGVSKEADSRRALRHAYTDLVSTFEFFCSRKAAQITTESTNFQRLRDTRRFFKTHLSVDILASLDENERLLLRRAFQKRHLVEHNHGIVNERYARKIPEDAHLLGKEVPLSMDEFRAAAHVLRHVLDALTQAVERRNKPLA